MRSRDLTNDYSHISHMNISPRIILHEATESKRKSHDAYIRKELVKSENNDKISKLREERSNLISSLKEVDAILPNNEGKEKEALMSKKGALVTKIQKTKEEEKRLIQEIRDLGMEHTIKLNEANLLYEEYLVRMAEFPASNEELESTKEQIQKAATRLRKEVDYIKHSKEQNEEQINSRIERLLRLEKILKEGR